MIDVNGVSKAYGGQVLFEDVSVRIDRSDRLGLVGPNGAGKSTLFAIILGHLEPDAGQVRREKNAGIGHLAQETAPVGDETVLDLAVSITPEVGHLRRHLAAVESGREAEVPWEEAEDPHRRFETLGGYELEPKAKRILAGLGFREADFDRPARELSGGWVMRAHLARLLTREPDLLMLDEPTNHLDLEALLWFQGHLKAYSGGILLISHDREFLNQTVNGILDVRHAGVHRYQGNYDAYEVERDARDRQRQAAYDNQQREIARLQAFADRFRAKASKASQAQSKLKQIERMEKVEAPLQDQRSMRLSFPAPKRSGQRVIALKEVCHAYGDHQVYDRLDFEVQRGQRVVLVGPNGAGKSTLLKILAGVLPFQSGQRELGHHVEPGYFAQYRTENLNPGNTVLEEALATPGRPTEQTVRNLLGGFLFSGDDVKKSVSILSGGEKTRLALLKLLLAPPNLLLMDEPTTHLDMGSIEALVQALKDYQGTLVFISHDVYFIRAIANHVVRIEAGELTAYPGGYDYYVDKTGGGAHGTGQGLAEPRSSAPRRTREEIRAEKRREAEIRQRRSRERKKLESRMTDLEARIARAEARQAELTAELEKPELYDKPSRALELNRELMVVVDDLKELNAAWESVATRLEDFVAA